MSQFALLLGWHTWGTRGPGVWSGGLPRGFVAMTMPLYFLLEASVLPPRRRRLWQAYIFLFSAAVCRRRRAAAATSAQPLPLLGSDPVITNEGLCVLLTLCFAFTPMHFLATGVRSLVLVSIHVVTWGCGVGIAPPSGGNIVVRGTPVSGLPHGFFLRATRCLSGFRVLPVISTNKYSH